MKWTVEQIIMLIGASVWGIVILADVILTNYSPPPGVHAIMPGIFTVIGAARLVRRSNGKNGSS